MKVGKTVERLVAEKVAMKGSMMVALLVDVKAENWVDWLADKLAVRWVV